VFAALHARRRFTNAQETAAASLSRVVQVLVKKLFELVVCGEFFLFAAFLFEAEKKPFSGRIKVFEFLIHGGTDPG
jgi:hypothetical protein